MQPKTPTEWFDWTGIESRKGKHLCSVCAPTKYSDGTPTEYGKWHGRFERVFLPKGEFRTNRQGNLEHTATGRTDIREFRLDAPEEPPERCPFCGATVVSPCDEPPVDTCEKALNATYNKRGST
jgi:hypothetical protein